MDSFIGRIKDEIDGVEKNRVELQDKLTKLNTFMFSQGFNSIGEFQKRLLEKQAELMSNIVNNMNSYGDILKTRFADLNK